MVGERGGGWERRGGRGTAGLREYDTFNEWRMMSEEGWGEKKITTGYSRQMHAARTCAGEAALPYPTPANNARRDSWHRTVLLSNLQERLNGNYDSVIHRLSVILVCKDALDTL